MIKERRQLQSTSPINEIHITDIKIPNCTIDIKAKIAKNIFSKNKLKFIIEYLRKFTSLKYLKYKSATKRLRKCKTGKRIPLDVLIEICKILKLNVYRIEKYITLLHAGHDKSGWKIKFPLEINEDLAYVSEAIRTEGNILYPFQGIAIPNTELTLLKRMETALKKLGIFKKSLYKLIHIRMKRPNSKIIRITKEDGSNLHFLVADDITYKTKIIQFTDSIDSLNVNKIYRIKLEGNKEISLKISIKEGKIKIETKPETLCRGVLRLVAYNSVLAKFLHYNLLIQTDKKSHKIFLPDILKNASLNVLKEIIGVVVSCEGHVGFYEKNLDRFIRIKLQSKEYLENLRGILKKFNIESRIGFTTDKMFRLTISRQYNLLKFFKLFPLYHINKRKIINKIVESYSETRLEYYKADLMYLSYVKRHQPVTPLKLSKLLNKDDDHTRARLNKLFRSGLLERKERIFNGKGSTPLLYSISKSGEEKL